MSDSRRLVDKLWSYCNVLRDDGVGVIEYTEQLTYLLFLKMAHERATRSSTRSRSFRREYSWQKLLDAEGTELEDRLHAHPGRPCATAGHARHDLPQGAEPDPGPGEAQAPDRRPDRQGELVGLGHRHQGRRLRGVAEQGRRRHEVRRRAVLHAARADPGDRRCRRPDARRHGRRPGRAAPAASCWLPTNTPPARPQSLTPTKRKHLRDDFVTGSNSSTAQRGSPR